MTSDRFGATYEHLKAIARRIGARGQSLSPTEVVHEAWLRLDPEQSWNSESHFRAVAAKAMRAVIVDRLRARNAQKRGGGWNRVTLQGLSDTRSPVSLLDLVDALDALDAIDPRLGQIAELRLFGGMEVQEVADRLEVSPRTVKRDWRTARAWLVARLETPTV